ncbi:hypothetical protein C8Q76DRAFT_141274 [Earliella scabrosa]|nr:hypothetical protein C8Q76DRAFT_141274 [Earliella scabrosa]
MPQWSRWLQCWRGSRGTSSERMRRCAYQTMSVLLQLIVCSCAGESANVSCHSAACSLLSVFRSGTRMALDHRASAQEAEYGGGHVKRVEEPGTMETTCRVRRPIDMSVRIRSYELAVSWPSIGTSVRGSRRVVILSHRRLG